MLITVLMLNRSQRYYYFTSVTVSKEGKEVVISNQERRPNRISKLLSQGRVTWINSKFSPHPNTRDGKPLSLDDSNKPTQNGNQPALLGVGSPELSVGKDSTLEGNVQEKSGEKSGFVKSERNKELEAKADELTNRQYGLEQEREKLLKEKQRLEDSLKGTRGNRRKEIESAINDVDKRIGELEREIDGLDGDREDATNEWWDLNRDEMREYFSKLSTEELKRIVEEKEKTARNDDELYDDEEWEVITSILEGREEESQPSAAGSDETETPPIKSEGTALPEEGTPTDGTDERRLSVDESGRRQEGETPAGAEGEAGLVENGLALGLDRRQMKLLDTIGKAIGYKVVVTDRFGLDANGMWDEKSRTVYVSKDAEGRLDFNGAFGHEVMHDIYAVNKKLADVVEKIVKDAIGKDFGRMVARKTEIYRNHYEGNIRDAKTDEERRHWEEMLNEVDDAYIRQEIVCDQMGVLLNDERFADRLIGELDPDERMGFMERVLESVKNGLKYITGGEEYRTLKKMEGLWTKALKREQEKNIDHETTPPMESAGTAPEAEGAEMYSLPEEEQFEKEIERKAKDDGTWMKAPNGKDSKLGQKQWVMVRTDVFKNWFGDFEKQATREFLVSGEPVATLRGERIVARDGQSFVDAVEEMFSKQGGRANSPFGEVLLDRKGVKNDVKHGMGVDKNIAFASVKNVLENGRVLLPLGYYGTGGKKQMTGVVAAPIVINGKRYVCAVEVIANKENSRLYVHEVSAIEKLQGDVASNQVRGSETASPHPQGEIAKLVQDFVTTKVSSKIVDENGEPLVVYHDTNSTIYVNRETGQNWDDLDWREKAEWDGRDDWDEHWEERDFYTFDNKNHGRESIEVPGFFFSPEPDPYHEYGERRVAAYLNIKNPIFDPVIPNRGVSNTAGRDAMEEWIRQGYDGMIRTNEDGSWREVVAFRPEQVKSADDVTYDDAGEVIPLSERFDEGKKDIRWSMKEDEKRDVFYSPAERAVEGIKQEKAKAEQWLAMIQKGGGLKAGEDKWMGLSEWLNERKGQSLTKQEVLDFIRENDVKVEEVEYEGAGTNVYDVIERETGIDLSGDDFQFIPNEHIEFPGTTEKRLNLARKIDDRYGWGFTDYYDLSNESSVENYIREVEREFLEKVDSIIDREESNKQANSINETRLKYTTKGLENNREIAFVVPGVEPYHGSMSEVHFDDERTQGRAVAWARFGETTDADGKRVLVIDEVQSQRHQDGREDGYKSSFDQSELDRARKELKEYSDYLYNKYIVGQNLSGDFLRYANEEERKRWDEQADKVSGLNLSKNRGVPDAPFEKNWHELAMKRMLRYAAENGFDKVAWTKGEQQAERYNIGDKIETVSILDGKHGGSPSYRAVVLSPKGGTNNFVFFVNSEGEIRNTGDFTTGEFTGKNISEVIGKELSEKLLSSENGTVLSGEELRIGGEGMKGFYDRMLPSFMNKYGKKWGVKVGEVELPKVEEVGRTMWSVDVTPEMKESVMQGQPKFSLKEMSEEEREKSERLFEASKEKFGVTNDVREAGYILPDGSMLDFSGRHELDRGTDSSFLRGRRSTDHREISKVAYGRDADGNETVTGVETSMPDFIGRGAIRIDSNAGVINLSVAPTSKQKASLRRLIAMNDGDVSVDFGNGWDSDHYVEYESANARRVLGDIDRYFSEGIRPEGNIRLSLPEEKFHSVIDAMFDDADFDKTVHARERYDLGTTPEWMKGIGISGERFTISFKNIRIHLGKDADHNLTAKEWHELPSALKHPFLVTSYGNKGSKFRLYTTIKVGDKFAIAGVDVVKVNQGKGTPMLELNRIKTVFGRDRYVVENGEKILAWDKNITPEQEALLRGHNYREYPSIQELSAGKDSALSGNDQTNHGENFQDLDNPSAKLSIVEDRDEIERLEKEELVPGYRNVVMNAGGDFGSPMAGTLGNTGRGKEKTLPFSKGVWEKSDERPWLADDKGKVNLGKPDGLGNVDKVDYNPYIHIRPNMVNKQFKNAWERRNLVYVLITVLMLNRSQQSRRKFIE